MERLQKILCSKKIFLYPKTISERKISLESLHTQYNITPNTLRGMLLHIKKDWTTDTCNIMLNERSQT